MGHGSWSTTGWCVEVNNLCLRSQVGECSRRRGPEGRMFEVFVGRPHEMCIANIIKVFRGACVGIVLVFCVRLYRFTIQRVLFHE